MQVLVVNAGSSTLKLRVVDGNHDVTAAADIDPWEGNDSTDAIASLLESAGPVGAVGHRVVHGGRDFTSSRLVTPAVEAAVRELTPLAPLHQPRALAALAAARQVLPEVPHVACFDTAFHTTMPAATRTYALPAAWRHQWGLERFGFHGLSHAWAARRGLALAGLPDDARVVSCHLGAGASLCASVAGRSVDTTMGFTPLDGLVMATRSGSVDPGLVLWLLSEGGLDVAAVRDGLEHHGGLAGLAGGLGDMRDVLTRRAAGDMDASLAFDVYVHRLRQGIASMASSLGGVDLLVFTGGVGEHAAPVRSAAMEGLAFLGIAADADANAVATCDADVSADGASTRTMVVTSREDLEVDRAVREVVA